MMQTLIYDCKYKLYALEEEYETLPDGTEIPDGSFYRIIREEYADQFSSEFINPNLNSMDSLIDKHLESQTPGKLRINTKFYNYVLYDVLLSAEDGQKDWGRNRPSDQAESGPFDHFSGQKDLIRTGLHLIKEFTSYPDPDNGIYYGSESEEDKL